MKGEKKQMKTLYATKPDRNGNTYKLVIDTERKLYAEENAGFFHRADAVTITRKKLRELKTAAISAGYTYTNAL